MRKQLVPLIINRNGHLLIISAISYEINIIGKMKHKVIMR